MLNQPVRAEYIPGILMACECIVLLLKSFTRTSNGLVNGHNVVKVKEARVAWSGSSRLHAFKGFGIASAHKKGASIDAPLKLEAG
jgi:hypothetical protein